MSRRTLWVAMLVAACLSGCTAVTRTPVPIELIERAEVPGMPGVRDWGGRFSQKFQADLVESARQVRRINPEGLVDASGVVNVLAVSGGGANGAYGAGLLCGWTDSGSRPTFKLVTGISTGALIAPFAFLGSDHDQTIQDFYTSVSTPDIYTEHSMLRILWGTDALTDTSPLAKLLTKCVDEKVLAAVAEEHRKGRRLYIGTTNLDAGQFVVWNMSAIAASGHPDALGLFRDIMRASASIPVAFPPVYVTVEADGTAYDEMHVDGGASTQVFFYGFMLDIAAAAKEAGVEKVPSIRLYIIRNAQIKSSPQQVKARLLPIAGRAVSDLLFTQGIGDLYRIYTIATRDGIDFNLASIPETYESQAKETFDREAMKRLFDLGFQQAAGGYPWRKLPPGLEEK